MKGIIGVGETVPLQVQKLKKELYLIQAINITTSVTNQTTLQRVADHQRTEEIGNKHRVQHHISHGRGKLDQKVLQPKTLGTDWQLIYSIKTCALTKNSTIDRTQ